MPVSIRTLLRAGVALAALAGPAYAADVTAETAASLERQVRQVAIDLLGKGAAVPERIIRVTPAGDRFTWSIPLDLPSFPNGFTLSGTARPLDGGRWEIGYPQIPSPLDFTMDAPVPQKDPKAKPVMTAIPYRLTLSGQSGSSIWDPTFASPSSFNTRFSAMTLETTGGPMPTRSSAGPSSGVGTLTPTSAGRVDLKSTSTLTDYTVVTSTPGAGPVQMTFKKVDVALGVRDLSRERAITFMQTLVALGDLRTASSKPGAPPVGLNQETLRRTLVETMADLLTGARFEETVEGVTLSVQGISGGLNQMKLGFDIHGDQGQLVAAMDLALAGLTLPDLPIGNLAQLIPTRIEIHPSISGLNAAELRRLFADGASGKDSATPNVAALIAPGGARAAIDSLVIEMGGATLSGEAKVLITGPTSYTADAQIVADKFDTLMQQVSTMPEAAQAVPVLALVKGMGRVADSKLIWDLAWKDEKLFVNGIDLSAMMGGGAKAQPQRQAPPRPAR